MKAFASVIAVEPARLRQCCQRGSSRLGGLSGSTEVGEARRYRGCDCSPAIDSVVGKRDAVKWRVTSSASPSAFFPFYRRRLAFGGGKRCAHPGAIVFAECFEQTELGFELGVQRAFGHVGVRCNASEARLGKAQRFESSRGGIVGPTFTLGMIKRFGERIENV